MKTRIDITIKEKPAARSKRKPDAKPIIQKGRSPDVLSRRKGGFINFHDMGQVANGVGGWIDTNFRITNNPISDPSTLFAPYPTTSDFANRDSTFLGDGNRYRKITKGELSSKYVLAVGFDGGGGQVDTLPEWTGNGLKLTQAQLDAEGLSVGTDLPLKPFFHNALIADSQPNIKITGLPSYGSPSVAFRISPRMDVYLPPVLLLLRGEGTYDGSPGDRETYGQLYTTFPRRFGINTTDFYSGGSVPTPSGIDAQTLSAISNWQSIISGRAYHFDNGTMLWSLGSFPGSATDLGITQIYFTPDGTGSHGINTNGVLMAMVKQGGQSFYFWTDGY